MTSKVYTCEKSFFCCKGAYFELSDSPDPGIEYLCRLSSDYQQILISEGHLPINMKQILEVKTLTGEGNEEKTSVIL